VAVRRRWRHPVPAAHAAGGLVVGGSSGHAAASAQPADCVCTGRAGPLGLIKDQRNTLSSTSLTGSFVIGTPAYMAPEQLGPEPVDARADVYALGIVLYEMLAGHPPIRGDTPLATIMAQASQPAPPLSDFVDVPKSLEAVVMRAIAKDKTSRFGTMREFGAALSEPVDARPHHNLASIVRSATKSVESWSDWRKRGRNSPAGRRHLRT
jgi:serine/threonine protein kinase